MPVPLFPPPSAADAEQARRCYTALMSRPPLLCIPTLHAAAFLFEDVDTEAMTDRIDKLVKDAHRRVRESFPMGRMLPVDIELRLVQIELLALVVLELHAHRRHQARKVRRRKTG